MDLGFHLWILDLERAFVFRIINVFWALYFVSVVVIDCWCMKKQ